MAERSTGLEPAKLSRPGVLTKDLFRFWPMKGPDLPARSQRLAEYIESRIHAGVWPYRLKYLSGDSRVASVENEAGERFTGLEFTRVDYLGLARHPDLAAAAHAAIDAEGVHACSTGPLMGSGVSAELLRTETAGLLACDNVFLFPSGWSASFGAVVAPVRPNDHVVMDELAHQSLQQGAYAATSNVVKFRHLSNGDAESRLRAIRASDARAGILVVTEGLFSMDGDAPRLAELLQICREFDAYLCVDVAHDLGCTGPGGTGTLGRDGILGQVDIVCGAFSKTFGATGGFVVTPHRGVHYHTGTFSGSYTYATMMSPASAAAALAGLRLARSDEGAARRATLARRSQQMRELCRARGLDSPGSDTPIVPVLIGDEATSRIACRLSFERGLLATVLEFPVVRKGLARYRLSMNPQRSDEDMVAAADIMAACITDARELAEMVTSAAASGDG